MWAFRFLLLLPWAPCFAGAPPPKVAHQLNTTQNANAAAAKAVGPSQNAKAAAAKAVDSSHKAKVAAAKAVGPSHNAKAAAAKAVDASQKVEAAAAKADGPSQNAKAAEVKAVDASQKAEAAAAKADGSSQNVKAAAAKAVGPRVKAFVKKASKHTAAPAAKVPVPPKSWKELAESIDIVHPDSKVQAKKASAAKSAGPRHLVGAQAHHSVEVPAVVKAVADKAKVTAAASVAVPAVAAAVHRTAATMAAKAAPVLVPPALVPATPSADVDDLRAHEQKLDASIAAFHHRSALHHSIAQKAVAAAVAAPVAAVVNQPLPRSLVISKAPATATNSSPAGVAGKSKQKELESQIASLKKMLAEDEALIAARKHKNESSAVATTPTPTLADAAHSAIAAAIAAPSTKIAHKRSTAAPTEKPKAFQRLAASLGKLSHGVHTKSAKPAAKAVHAKSAVELQTTASPNKAAAKIALRKEKVATALPNKAAAKIALRKEKAAMVPAAHNKAAAKTALRKEKAAMVPAATKPTTARKAMHLLSTAPSAPKVANRPEAQHAPIAKPASAPKALISKPSQASSKPIEVSKASEKPAGSLIKPHAAQVPDVPRALPHVAKAAAPATTTSPPTATSTPLKAAELAGTTAPMKETSKVMAAKPAGTTAPMQETAKVVSTPAHQTEEQPSKPSEPKSLQSDVEHSLVASGPLPVAVQSTESSEAHQEVVAAVERAMDAPAKHFDKDADAEPVVMVNAAGASSGALSSNSNDDEEQDSELEVSTTQAPAATPNQGWSWWHSLLSWFTGSKASSEGAVKVANNHTSRKVTKKKLRVQKIKQTPRGSPSQVTEMEALDDQRFDVRIEDAWRNQEGVDEGEVQLLHHEDIAASIRAKKKPVPSLVSYRRKSAEGRVSSFWGQLEKEDGDIESSMNDDDVTRFETLSKQQDDEVMKAAAEAERGEPKEADSKRATSLLERRVSGTEGGAPVLHEAWEEEVKAKRRFELNMMQLSATERHRKAVELQMMQLTAREHRRRADAIETRALA